MALQPLHVYQDLPAFHQAPQIQQSVQSVGAQPGLQGMAGSASIETCTSIVHSLMCHRQGGESEQFAKRAVGKCSFMYNIMLEHTYNIYVWLVS